MTDAEIDEMQKQINKEAGIDAEDGGVDVPDGYRWYYKIPIR